MGSKSVNGLLHLITAEKEAGEKLFHFAIVDDYKIVVSRKIKKGFVKGHDPSKDTVYPHKKPALVLTKAEVSEARLHKLDYRKTGLGIHYMVELHLSEKARKDLADSFEGNEMRLLTVLVDGKYWGLHRYEKDKSKESVPVQARAETFAPTVGYFSSESKAQRLVDAFK